MELSITRLMSGGLITNYNCTSRCAHCLYACGPNRPKDFITPQRARIYLRTMKRMGCASIHIGGGEPFLDPEGLAYTLEAASLEGVPIEYVETNSSWFRSAEEATELLYDLKKLGLTTLLISISPFHNQYIPLRKPREVMEACRSTGVRIFPWIMDFWADIEVFEANKPHSLASYKERFGLGYLRQLPQRYWIHLGGRAVGLYAGLYDPVPLRRILDQSGPCRELSDTSHFHIDLYGAYIPGLCAGLAFNQRFLGDTAPSDLYPILTMLYSSGVGELYRWAVEETGYEPKPAYLNKCHLCLDIRRALFSRGWRSADIRPEGFYENLD